MMQPSTEIAYWLGVVQTDGYFRKYYLKRKGVNRFTIQVSVREKSLPMLKKFQDISKRRLNRDAKVFFDKNTGNSGCKIGVGELLEDFTKLDMRFSKPPKPSKWCLENPLHFGAYLAGIIDGDGNVDIRRPSYPQCAIRIAGSKPPIDLQKAVNKILNCSSNITFVEKWKPFPQGVSYFAKTYTLEFLVSKKNYDLIEKLVLPWITIPHKRQKLTKFIKKKKAAPGI